MPSRSIAQEFFGSSPGALTRSHGSLDIKDHCNDCHFGESKELANDIIEKLRPDLYVVNEDGDKPEKRAFCEKRGIEYRVLKREPKTGLPRRASTSLRGF